MLGYGTWALVYWYQTETAGMGDMRPYILVQLIPMVLIPTLLLLYKPRYTHGGMLLAMAGWYALAKVFEGLDTAVYHWTGLVSGHAIKHVLAAMAAGQVVWMLERRVACDGKETVYLSAIPGMKESIREGMAEPVEQCGKGLGW